MRRALLTGLLGLLFAAPAYAQAPAEPADEALCADRPGLASSTCTVDPGRVHVELAVDWSFQEDGAERVETLLAGATVVRVGIAERTEVQLGWTPYGRVSSRRPGGGDTVDGVADVSVGVRRLLLDRGGATLAVQAAVTAPVGGDAIGAGDWGASLLVPVGIELGGGQLLITPGIEAAVDADRDGRHLAYGLAIGYGFNLSERLSTSLDLAVSRDDDPLGATNEALAAIAFAWQVHADLQLDIGAVFGLNADSPDLELYVGAAQRF